MPTRRPLLVGVAWTVFGNGFFHACQLGVLVLLAKFADPAVQGQYLLALAIATPVLAFFGLELRGAFVADAAGQFTFGTYRRLRNLAATLAALVLLAALAWQAVIERPPPAYLAILAALFAARVAWSLAEVGWGTFQRRERLDQLGQAVALRGLTLLLPFVILVPPAALFVRSGRDLPGGTAAAVAAATALHATAMFALLFSYDRRRVRATGFDRSASWAATRALAWQTLPLGVVAVLIQLCDAWPRVLIEAQPGGKALLGYFGSLAYITLAGNLVIIQTMTAAANRLANYYQHDRRAFLRLGAGLVGLAAALGVLVLAVAVAAGRWILRILYTREYAQFEHEFQVIVLAHSLALITNVLGAATTQMRLFWVQVPVQVVTLAAAVLAAGLLIPGPEPVRGAAYTVLVRAVVQLLLYALCFALGLSRRPTAAIARAANDMGEDRGRRDSNPQPPP